MKEKEWEEVLEKNLSKIESGLRLIKRQKKVSTGIIDLLCKDKKGNYVVVEIKRKPTTNVVAQLARYNIAFIEKGVCKSKLRTILVAPEFSKTVKSNCKFFNFETKKISKEIISREKERLNNYFKIKDREKVIKYIKKQEIVNQSMIARFLKIYYHTVTKLINDLKEENVINLTYFGGNKLITLK
ncbi:MAG: DUF91 domain-containing protein [Nanoarchaeota archaeon]|nr:DUF91 domain-containing protein [Nanoarchaeota archaeon]